MAQHKNLPSIFENKLFTGLEEKQINLKISSKEFIEFKEGDIIFKSGDKSEYLYLIVDGEAKIKLPGQRRLPLIDQKGINEFFGEKELIEKTDRKSSAIANKDTILYPIPNDKLIELANKNKKIKLNLYKFSKLEAPDELTEESTAISDSEKEGVNESINVSPDENINQTDDTNIQFAHPDQIKEPEENSISNFNVTETNSDQNEILNTESVNKDDVDSKYIQKEIPQSTKVDKKEEGDHKFYNKYFGKFTEAFNDENIDNKKLSEILQALQRINSRLNIDEVVFSISETTKNLTGSDESFVFIVNRDKHELLAKYKSENEILEFKYKLNETLSGVAVENYQIINIKNVDEDKRYSPEKENLTNIEARSALYFPITSGDGIIVAVIQLLSTQFNKFSNVEENILSILSIHAAQAIQNAMIIESTLYEDRKNTLSKVVSFLSNDIHQPIHAINEYIEKADSNGHTDKLKPLFELIKEKTTSINNFSEALIHYTSDQYHMKEYELQFSNVINKILENIAEYVESRNSKLYKKINADAMVNVNPNALYQAMYQTIKNACDSMPEGGNIFVTISKEDEQIVTEVKDIGLGVPESIKQEIFEPFMTQGKPNGVGLGLAVTKKIIEDHKGKIIVESDLGEGSKFKIYLPIVDSIG